MDTLSAFVGHSFDEQDRQVVSSFTDFLNHMRDVVAGFHWDHAEPAEPKELALKVKQKMEDKNLLIAICTEREVAVKRQSLRRIPFFKDRFHLREQEFHAKTSDWILAEVGYAVGKGMDVIILLENGVKPPEGPQGNVEYIPFDRERPTECQTKIMEMLSTLIHKTAPKEAKPKTQDLPPREPEPSVPDQAPAKAPASEDRSKWGRDEYQYEIMKAIAAGDSEGERALHEEYDARVADNESARVWMDARTLWYHYTLKKKDTLPDLLALLEKYPIHPMLNGTIGLMYSLYGEEDTAAEYFARAASSETNTSEKLRYLCSQAYALADAGNLAPSKSIVVQAIELAEQVQGGQMILLPMLVEISKHQTQTESFIAYSERLLELQPEHGSTRFDLAYKYSDLGEHGLALYHYSFLTEWASSSASWNNLGVTQDNLGLPSLAVRSYRKSEKMGGTLAMSNLAQSFINAGFLDEAKELCGRAMAIEDHDEEIGKPISRLRTVPEKEDEKAKEVMEGAKAKRRVYLGYAGATLKPMKSVIEGAWASPQCRLTLAINQGRFEASGTYGISMPSIIAPSYGPPATKSQPMVVVYGVWYTGDVLGHGIQYKKWESEGKTKPEKETDPSSEGFMVLSDDHKRLQVYPLKGKQAGETYEIRAEGD